MTTNERASRIEELLRIFKVINLDENNEEDLDDEDRERLHSSLEKTKQRLLSYTDQLFDGVFEAIVHGDEMLSMDIKVLVDSPLNSTADVHEHVAFRPHLSPDADLGTVRSILRGIHHYSELPQSENYAEASAEVQAQVIALIKVTEAMDERFVTHPTSPNCVVREQGMTMVSGHELIEVILSHPAEAERIVAILIDRETVDTALITSILDTPAPALSNAIL